jgi:hypothetical protein
MRFGRLVVLSFQHSKRSHKHWLCRCDCGTEKIIDGMNLRRGDSKSCGCLPRDKMVQRLTTHNRSRTKEYRIWIGILTRCYRENASGYKNYGGRGIKVCEVWRESFQAFFDDIGPMPTPQHTIERRNNDGDYEPTNCFWATRKEQGQNRRNNHLLTYNGETLSLASWADKVGVPYCTLHTRVLRYGWTVHDALTTPVRPCRKRSKQATANIRQLPLR